MDQVQEYFPTFCKEEGQMKLLTLKAAVSMHKKAKGLEQLMNALGTNDPEEITRLVVMAKQMEQEQTKQPEDENNLSEYDSGNDIWLDSELQGMEEEIRNDILREIGEAGERYAFERIQQYFLEDGYLVKTANAGCVELYSDDEDRKVRNVVVWKPDSEGYHQSGWDIKTELFDADGGRETYYLEVKTHTPNSRWRTYFSILNEQIRTAASKGNYYVLLSVIYDYNKKQALKMDSYRDFIRQLAIGNMRNTAERYIFIQRQDVMDALNL